MTWSRSLPPDPWALPGVWPAASSMRTHGPAGCPSGHPALDAVLAGGGWPRGGLIEVLSGVRGAPSPLGMALLTPTLSSPEPPCTPGVAPPHTGGVVWVDPPAVPSVGAWHIRGLRPDQWVQVQAGDPVRRVWACEQALACPQVGAVVVWLPHAPFGALRRLQWAASRHGGLLWAHRPLAARGLPSPAVLRLQLGLEPCSLAASDAEGPQLVVEVFKQRGLAAPVVVRLPLADAWVQPWLQTPPGLERVPASVSANRAVDAIAPEPSGHAWEHDVQRLLDRVARPELTRS